MGLSSLINKVKKVVEAVDVGSSITVTEVDPNFQFCFEKKSCYCFTKDCTVRIKGTRTLKKGATPKKFEMTCVFKKGFTTDGASAPEFAKFIVPAVKEGDDIYNAAPFIHDGLYMYKGKIDGAELTRDECDDILRGIWRISGMSRTVAGVADLGTHVVAGSSDHWGNASAEDKKFFKATFKYV